MDENIPEKIIDISGVELMPGEPAVCLGNGENGFECCCDECDYYLLCSPNFAPPSHSFRNAPRKNHVDFNAKKD